MQVILTSLFKRSFNEIFEYAQGVYSQRTLSSLFQEITRYKRILVRSTAETTSTDIPNVTTVKTINDVKTGRTF